MRQFEEIDRTLEAHQLKLIEAESQAKNPATSDEALRTFAAICKDFDPEDKLVRLQYRMTMHLGKALYNKLSLADAIGARPEVMAAVAAQLGVDPGITLEQWLSREP